MNRSKPHLELVASALSVLVNIAKCCKTKKAVFSEPECGEVLVDEMQLNREYAPVFQRSVELLLLGCESFPTLARVC